MRVGLKMVIVMVFIGLIVVNVQAETLDFSVYSSGNTGLSALHVGAATATISNGTVYVYRPGDFGAFTTSGGLCALNRSGNAQTDWRLDFDYTVKNLVFESAFYNPIDLVNLQYFDGATFIGQRSITGDGVIDLSGIPRITSLVFDDSSTGAGFGFGDFSFNRASSVPVPAPILLLGSGLLGLAGFRKKVKR
jgi:hypothetical protein